MTAAELAAMTEGLREEGWWPKGLLYEETHRRWWLKSEPIDDLLAAALIESACLDRLGTVWITPNAGTWFVNFGRGKQANSTEGPTRLAALLAAVRAMVKGGAP